jgi:hypothetical protein
MVLLDASYAIVLIKGIPIVHVELVMVDRKERVIGSVEDFDLGEAGVGELCLMVFNKEGFLGGNKHVKIRFNWYNIPFHRSGTFEFEKFWTVKSGDVVTKGQTEDSFPNERMNWDTNAGDKCSLLTVYWFETKHLPPQGLPGSNVVAHLLVRKHKSDDLKR